MMNSIAMSPRRPGLLRALLARPASPAIGFCLPKFARPTGNRSPSSASGTGSSCASRGRTPWTSSTGCATGWKMRSSASRARSSPTSQSAGPPRRDRDGSISVDDRSADDRRMTLAQRPAQLAPARREAPADASGDAAGRRPVEMPVDPGLELRPASASPPVEQSHHPRESGRASARTSSSTSSSASRLRRSSRSASVRTSSSAAELGCRQSRRSGRIARSGKRRACRPRRAPSNPASRRRRTERRPHAATLRPSWSGRAPAAGNSRARDGRSEPPQRPVDRRFDPFGHAAAHGARGIAAKSLPAG